MKPSVAGPGLALLTVLLAAVGVQVPRAPESLPADSPADRFSAHRAWKHLEAIAREPHPVGSAEHERVRGYVVGELAALGLTPELQSATSLVASGGTAVGAQVTNVLARLPGREDGKALLLASHYDSVPAGPGAADDGVAVAAMLESARALGSGPPLARDVVFLFSDAEELGLLGARAFVDQHPWADEVAVALNFEARGTRGPALMFETSAGNARLVRELRRLDHPAAASFGYEVYKRMPNDTDFTVFKRAGMAGLNFAFIHGATAYHTAQDSLARLDRDSLQHQGEMALELSRRLAGGGLEGYGEAGDAVFFNLPGVFVTYPQGRVLPLALLLAVATVLLLVAGLRRRRLAIGPLLLGLVVHLLGAVVLGLLLVVVASRLLMRSPYSFALWNGWTSTSLYLLALALVGAAVTVLVHRWASRKLDAASLMASGLVLWLVPTLLVSLVAPGASYLFALPLIFAIPAAALWLARTSGESESVTPGQLATLALVSAASALLWAPALALIGVALGSPAALVIGLFVFLILMGLLAPVLELLRGLRRWWVVPGAALALGLILIVAVRLASRFDADNRRPNSLFYLLDAEEGSASWMSFNRAPDSWTRQFLTDAPERASRPEILGFPIPILRSSAQPAPLGGPEVTLVTEQEASDVRTLEVRITAPFTAHSLRVALEPRAEIRALTVGGQRVEPDSRRGPTLVFSAPPASGLELSVEMTGGSPLEVEVVGQRYGLPDLPGFSYEPRPPDMMASSAWTTDSTFVRSVTVLEGGAVPDDAQLAERQEPSLAQTQEPSP